MIERVFVYGSLRRDQYNHACLGSSPCLGQCSSAPGYVLYDLGPYPAVVRAGEGSVVGEVYAVEAEILAALDHLEGYPDFYDRHLMDTPYGEAWIYFIRRPAPDWRPVPHGDWLGWLQGRGDLALNTEDHE